MNKTATDFRNDAARLEQEAHDSFERCDTDGFLSQWASGLNAQLAHRKADILDAGGKSEFLGLFEGDRRVKARMFTKTFDGWRSVTSWLLHDDEVDLIAKRGKKFLPIGENSRILKSLGLKERWETAPAEAVFKGRGTGLSGTCWVATVRTGDKWGMDAELVL